MGGMARHLRDACAVRILGRVGTRRMERATRAVGDRVRRSVGIRLARSRKEEALYQDATLHQYILDQRGAGLKGAQVVRLGGSAVRQRLTFLKRPPRIPDPGQPVDLRTEAGSWRKGFRALSGPWTADTGEVVIWVATEDEYRAAGREGRSAVGVPWPTQRMRVSSFRLPWRLSYG